MAADFEVKKDGRGEYFWTLQADNNKVIARSSESYGSKRDCLRSIQIVKDKAPGCPVWDMTTSPPQKVETLPSS